MNGTDEGKQLCKRLFLQSWRSLLCCAKSLPAAVGTHKQQVWQKQSFYVATGSACQRNLVLCFPVWSPEFCPDLESSWVLNSSCRITRKPLCSQHFWKSFWVSACWDGLQQLGLPTLLLTMLIRALWKYLIIILITTDLLSGIVNSIWKKPHYIEKKIHAEISSCLSKNVEDRMSKF